MLSLQMESVAAPVGQGWVEIIDSQSAKTSHCQVSRYSITTSPGVCETAKVKGAALMYLCCFTAAWPSTEPGQHWWNREKGIRAVPFPFIHAEVPAVCLIHAIKNCALHYFLGRVRKAAVKVASSCWELAKLMAASPQAHCGRKRHIKSGSL